MADDRTPLLGAGQQLPDPTVYVVQDHPIFLRVCHSPWRWISQDGLTYARGFITAYLTALAPMILNFKISRDDGHSHWFIVWQFSTLSFLLLCIYHAIVFSWTVTHRHWVDIDESDSRWKIRLLRVLSPPAQKHRDRRRFFFSLFYTTSHVFALINVLVYWAVLVPRGYGSSSRVVVSEESRVPVAAELSTMGWFEPFCIINVWGITALIVGIEVMFLNSVRRQVPVSGHIIGIVVLLSAYLGWAAVGKMVTGRNAYFFLDPDLVGGRDMVAAYSAGFVGLGPSVFAIMYGLIGLREKLTRR